MSAPEQGGLSEVEVTQLLNVWRAAGPCEVSPVAIIAAVNLILAHRAALAAVPAAEDGLRAAVEGLADLSAAATPGPWEVGRYFWKIGSTRGMSDEFWVSVENADAIVASMPEEATMSAPNATLIVAAVNLVRSLLAGRGDV